MAPIAAIKAATSLTRAAQNPIFYHRPVPVSFLSPGDVPQIRVIAFF